MKERWVEVTPNADGKQERQLETWLWGKDIPAGMMSLRETGRLTDDQCVRFRLGHLEKGKKGLS